MKRLRVVSALLLVAVLACGGAVLALLEALRPEAAAPEFADRRPAARTVRTIPDPATLPDVATARIHGFVRDPDGEPIEGAEVGGWGRGAITDADGAYAVDLPLTVDRVYVSALGFDDEVVAYELPEGATEVRVDVVLTPNTELLVWCAGLPDDACTGFHITCTSPLSPSGPSCLTDPGSGETLCRCPDGLDEVAIRGGGRAVLVDAREREAWLDFRDTGAIVGRVVPAPEGDHACRALALRIPTALEDLPRGLFVGREVRCEADGRFRIDGLVEGDWQLALTAEVGEGSYERVLVPRRVRPGDVVDVGDVRVPGGGAIEGVVIDGLTDAPAREEMVFAWREGASGERVTINGDESEEDGTFRIEGLPAGSWSVAPALAPHASVSVVVREDATSHVVVVTAEATALEDNGFSLAERDGRLVVEDVDAEGPAWEAGLSAGEEVVGVRLAGFDLAAAVGEDRAVGFARGVLAYWDGPGVTLVVRAPDGAEEIVPIEW